MNFLRIDIKQGAILALVAVLSLTGAGTVRAESIVISGNGSESTSEANATSTNTATVNQDNAASIDNNVNVTSNTGDNSASGNTGGDTAITTGNTSTDVSLTTSANASTATTGCCTGTQGGQAVISGNGTGTNNTANVNTSNTSSVQSNNTATITNTITGTANTGNNTANNNTYGNVSINTGNIHVSENIKNGPINSNSVSSAIGFTGGFDLKISGNGSHSQNTINLNVHDTNDVSVNNTANILNNSLWLLNTGSNNADNNTKGNVSIATGSITFLADILNGPINSNSVDIDCCEEEEPEKPGAVKEEPKTPVNQSKDEHKPSESKSSGNGRGGDVLAAVDSKILPVTGNYTLLFFLLGNVAMFLLGLILRLRSGNSPGTIA